MSAASSVTFNTDSKQPPHVPVTFLSVSGDNTIKIWTEQILDANDNSTSTSTSTSSSAPHSNASVSTRSITSSTPSTPSSSSATSSTTSSTSTTPQQSPRNHTVKTRWRLLKTYEGDTAEIRHMRQLPDGRFVIQVFGPQLTIIGIDAGPTITESSVDSPIGTGASAFTHVSELKGHSQYVMGLRVHTSGRLMSASIDGYIKLWNTDTNEAEISFAHGHTGLLTGGAVLCDGRVATTSYDKTIRIFDPIQKKHLFTLEGHGDAVVSSIALSDNRLLSWTQAEMKLWDTDSYECVNTINEGMVLNAIGLPDGRAAVSSWDKTIKIYAWDLSSVQLVLRGHTGSVMSTAYIPHQRLCSGAYDQTIRVWDLVTGRCLHVLNAHTSFVKCINHIQYPVDGWILRARARQAAAAAAAASNATSTSTSTTVPSVILPPLLPLNVMT